MCASEVYHSSHRVHYLQSNSYRHVISTYFFPIKAKPSLSFETRAVYECNCPIYRARPPVIARLVPSGAGELAEAISVENQ